ncbi:hypothetical protein GCM10017744_041910 [Streptomyces antimycoticus]|uniref:Uncharacterized protein n=1 Tax=Streptomyces antimycoticus TaxID=68175 RepID=A0A4D4KH02_9ACTN|nr:hypothetical protein SANT12839_060550 [Streptomyces antimycoticus]
MPGGVGARLTSPRPLSHADRTSIQQPETPPGFNKSDSNALTCTNTARHLANADLEHSAATHESKQRIAP